MASISRLGLGILNVLDKIAAGDDTLTSDSDSSSRRKRKQSGNTGGDMGDVEKEAAEQAQAFFDFCSKEASEAATDFFDSYVAGMYKRAQDEYELSTMSKEAMDAAGITVDLVLKAGGIPGLLDKIAMEDPGAVLPEELAQADAALPEADAGGLEGEFAEGAPVVGLDEGLGEEGLGGDDEAEAVIEELIQSGVPVEEIERALVEIESEGAGEMAPEVAPEMDMAPEMGEDPGMDMEPDKYASGVSRVRIDAAKTYIKQVQNLA